MTDTLRHRGPDDEGTWSDEQCSLGHRRLSVIDLSPAGRQPMANEDGTVQVVFNGEIYNFVELRAMLERAGHTFRSRTDTEVLVHLYEERGEAFVEELRGMFALAIWDARRRKLVLARDHFGQKPLFYTHQGGVLLFASEIKALTATDVVSREVDPQAVDSFLTVNFVPAPLSFYREIRRLPSAHVLSFTPGEAPRLRRYWSCPPHVRAIRAEEAMEEVDRQLTRAVREQLTSDVPLGVFLSGGIDSSLVAAKVADVAPGIETFSVGYQEEGFSELPYAKTVADILGVKHNPIVLSAADLGDPSRLIDLFDEPFADIAALPTAALCREARKHVTVALTGDGGDELFGGYQHHILGYWMSRVDVARSIRSRLARGALSLLPEVAAQGPLRKLRQGLGALTHAEWRDAVTWLRTTVHAEQRGQLYQREFLAKVRDEDPYLALRGVAGGINELFAPAADPMLADQFLYKTDIAAMATGLECRSPFLDVPLAEFGASLPPSLKVQRGSGKILLRRLLARRLPARIWGRKKTGFSMPVEEWIKRELAGLVQDTILVPGALVSAYVRPDVLRSMYEDHLAGRTNYRRTIWAVLLLELWLRRNAAARPERHAMRSAAAR